jgi:tRNA A-37 threonylcarbamoyl transferase component Bud32/tetratricopeptide (TPR) repeat protein
MTTCPPEATLRLIGTDAVGEDTFAGLEGHVEQCPDCQKILEAATSAVLPAIHPAPPRDNPPTLPDLYIKDKLGQGGTGVVYLAWEPVLKRHVAVKLFPTNALVDPHSREHWLSEARALSRVPHKNVVAIHRVGESKEWLWLVLEYVSGGTLKERLTEPLPPRDAARLIETIAQAVGYFHAHGVRHLDLKPSNILLDGEPGAPWESVSPKISDFGIARLEGEPGATETGANGPKGTPSYMAPEQVAAVPGTIGPAADLHALGAILYHMLTGRPPFQGASTAETFDQVRNENPVPPRRLNGRIPRDLETICLKCLEKVPDRRYRTAEALADDLRRWLDGRPIKGRRVSPVGHAWRLCLRHPAVASLLFTLALTLVTGVVGLFVLLNEAEAKRVRLGELLRNAEAYETFSASTADELGSFLRAAIRDQRNTAPDDMTASLLRLRNSVSDLRNQGIVPTSTIGILEEEIAWALVYFNKIEEARDPLKQAISDLKQSWAKHPEDKEVRSFLADAYHLSGNLAEGAGQLEDAMDSLDQYAAVLMAFEPSDRKYIDLSDVCMRITSLGDRPGQSGRTNPKERARRVYQRILRHLLGSNSGRLPDEFPPGPETLGRLFERFDLKKMLVHENEVIRRNHEHFVSNWLVLSIGPQSPFRGFCSASKSNRDPEAGATAFISAIREPWSKLGLSDFLVPMTISVILGDASKEAAEHRRLGRLDDARATAARLLALGRQLVREYPNSESSHRVLSEAYSQIRKNAFRTGDDQLVEEATVQAIVAARRALDLDPDNLETLRHLDTLTERLERMKADRKAMASSNP